MNANFAPPSSRALPWCLSAHISLAGRQHVDNGPSYGNVEIGSGNDAINTITLSPPVVDPVMAIQSLGNAFLFQNVVFQGATPVFVTGGQSARYGGVSISVSGSTVWGDEGNGTVGFPGVCSSISWTNPTFKSNGTDFFTFGAAGLETVPDGRIP
jgi:hypothetical protein